MTGSTPPTSTSGRGWIRAAGLLGVALGTSVLQPTALVAIPLLALFALRGLRDVSAFVVAGLAWFAATWLGLRAVQQRRMGAHVTWMARSYAIAWSAVSFRLIQVALDRLPARYGDVLEWKYVEGHSVKEIARRLDIGTEATQSLLARAKRAFADVYNSLTNALDENDGLVNT